MYRGYGNVDDSGSWAGHLRGVLLKRSAHPFILERAAIKAFQIAFPPRDMAEDLRCRNRFSYFFADTLGLPSASISGMTLSNGHNVPSMSIGVDGSFETTSLDLGTGHKPGDVVTVTWQPQSNDGSAQPQVGRIHLYGQKGFSIVTDTDDTIKDTRVLRTRESIRQAFEEDYKAIAGMPKLYQHWNKLLSTPEASDVAFHYLSSSPYSLLRSLERLFYKAKFPPGVLHLEKLRVKEPSTVFALGNPGAFKANEIHRITTTFPDRKYILVGDSTQADADAYGKILKSDPNGERYVCAFIRLVSGVDEVIERKNNRRSVIESAFDGVDRRRFYAFSDPAELMSVDLLNGKCKPAGKSDTDIGTFWDDMPASKF